MALSKRRGMLVNLALAAGTVLLYLGVVQGALLFSGEPDDPAHVEEGAYADIYRPSEDPILNIELTPGANGVVNADGYVGPRYPEEKPPGTFRVVGLGDSITMYYSAEEQNYLLLAERLLSAQGAGPVQILNFGVAGYDTPQEVRQLEVRGLAYAPDLVTLGYCLNDGVSFAFTLNEATGRFHFDPYRHDVPSVIDLVQRTVGSAQATVTPAAFFERVSASAHWQSSMTSLEALSALSREHGFDVVLIVFPVLADLDAYAFQPVHDALRAKARALGFGFLDLLPVYRRRSTVSELQTDPIHPSAVGHRLAAHALARYVTEHGYMRSEAPQ